MAEENIQIVDNTGLEWCSQIPGDYAMQAPRLCFWGKYHAYEFEGWRRESASWKRSCYIHAGLSFGIITSRIEGPDADRMLSENSVSDFKAMKPYRARHIIMCAENGNVIQDGIAVKLAENSYRVYDIAPYVHYVAQSGGYDVSVTDVSDEMFVFQLGGPKSLQIVEGAMKGNLHDLAFMNLRDVRIAGHDVQVLRMGMCGTLGYEVHGPIEAAHDVYNALIEAGEPHDLVKLGTMVYVCNHTENGIAQQPAHFIEAWKDDAGFAAWVESNFGIWFSPLASRATGTYTDDVTKHFRNPFELGWGKMVNFNHEFKGKEALEQIRDSAHAQICTLRWNDEDVADVFASQFGEREAYKPIELPVNYDDAGAMGDESPSYRVETADGTVVGASFWRVYTVEYKANVSLAFLDPKFAEQDTELTIVWGDAEGPQKRIRAVVDRFPFLDLPANVDFDIDAIPRYQA